MANYIGLDKGYLVLSTYNTSAAAGVLNYRFVKTGGSQGVIDLNVLATTIVLGVVQENIDAAKVLTGKAVANVRMGGISKMVAGAAVTVYTEIMSDTTGRAITAVTASNRVQGLALQTAGAAGDIIDVFLGINGRII